MEKWVEREEEKKTNQLTLSSRVQGAARQLQDGGGAANTLTLVLPLILLSL